MTLNYTTVTGEFADGTGTPLNGYVTFTPSAVVYASGVPVLQPETQITVQISAGQLGAVALLATDNVGLAVEGRTGFWYWTVQVIIGEALPPWRFFLPSSPAAVDLYSLANTPAGGTCLPLPAGSPADGEVPYVTATSPLELGWETPSGGGAVSTVFGRDGTVTAEAGDYTVTQVTGAAPLASPALTGTPTAPTATALTSDTQLATTGYADAAVTVEKTRAETAEGLLAPLASPALTGTPTAPTKPALISSTALATTAYADAAVAVETSRAETAEALAAQRANNLSDLASASIARGNLGLGSAAVQPASAFDAAGSAASAQAAAQSFATSAVAVETSRAETAEALALAKASNLSDLASVSTARTNLGLGSAATQPASTFDVSGAAASAQSTAESFATSAVAAETTRAETAEALKAPLASPAFTGTPAAPTAAALTDSTQVATTAYTDSAVAVETARAESAEALKAPLASPAFTGTPTTPTQAAGDNTTKIATDGFVSAAVSYYQRVFAA